MTIRNKIVIELTTRIFVKKDMKKASRIVSRPKTRAENRRNNSSIIPFNLLHMYFEIFVWNSSDRDLFGLRRFQISSIMTAAMLLTHDDIELKLI